MVTTTYPKIPETVAKPFQTIAENIESFCKKHLNEEYQEFAIKMLAKLARKRPSPLLSGRSNTWAAGIIHALGMVNFMFDKTQTPHVSSKTLCNYFNLGQSTVSGKSKSIRDVLKISWCPSISARMGKRAIPLKTKYDLLSQRPLQVSFDSMCRPHFLYARF
jgi:hypothetical protein